MKRIIAGLVLALGLIGLSAAQTVANGPYYAVPSWDQTLPAAQRFIVLANMNQEAVLDRETGLVWQRTPGSNTRVWDSARNFCLNHITGNKRGWRLPTFPELTSLMEATFAPVTLPAGHPFLGVNPQFAYWTASQVPDQPLAYTTEGGVATARNKSAEFAQWCVRGGLPSVFN